jgi:hypothetical protein
MTRLLLLLLDVAWPAPPNWNHESNSIGLDGIEENGATDEALEALNLWWLRAYGATDCRRQRQ